MCSFRGKNNALPNVPYPFIEALRQDIPQLKEATVVNYEGAASLV
jgi:hypothetical protein